MCFIRSRQNYLFRYHAIISYFSQLSSGKIKTFPVPLVYLIPFPAILKPNFPISRLKKWQIPRLEKALLAPYSSIFVKSKVLKRYIEYLSLKLYHLEDFSKSIKAWCESKAEVHAATYWLLVHTIANRWSFKLDSSTLFCNSSEI